MSFTVQLPLNKAKNSTYQNIEEEKEFVKQSVKNVLLTNPGERVMLPNFGVGLKRYLFENPDAKNLPSMIEAQVALQFENYLPSVSLSRVEVAVQEEALIVRVFYNLVNYNLQDFIQIAVVN